MNEIRVCHSRPDLNARRGEGYLTQGYEGRAIVIMIAYPKLVIAELLN